MTPCPHYKNYLNAQRGLEILQTSYQYHNDRISPTQHFMSGKLDDSDTTFDKTSSKLIPPLNTDIRFHSVLPEFQIQSKLSSFTTLFESEIPDEFSWHITLHSDTIDVIAVEVSGD